MDDLGELWKYAYAWSTAIAIVLSLWVRAARIAAGLLLGGLAIAIAALTAWGVAYDKDIDVATLLLFIAGFGLVGALFFLWGRQSATA